MVSKKPLLAKIFPFLLHPTSYISSFHISDEKSDFLFLPDFFSIKKHIYNETITLVITLSTISILFLIFFSHIFNIFFFALVSSLISIFYLAFMIFKIYIVLKSLNATFIEVSEEDIFQLKDNELPTYTIIIPLYREEKVIKQIIDAISTIDYPENKLDIIITLEEYDNETIEAIKKENPPGYFKTLILPNTYPKTKPKALNVAFLRAKGEYLVIYDAEIIPDKDQLKKAVLAFKKHPYISCLQTRLDHYNSNQNLLTKLFNAEFSFYYDLFLPGLQKLNFPIPLSGHSTHFRKAAIQTVGAWDPYNVAEDCDIGIRLYRFGYHSAILDSFSKEEATSDLKTWITQRTRWLKGFSQTSIVHLRHPYNLKKCLKTWKNFIAFLLIVPGTVFVNVLNLFFLIALIIWYLTHSPFIQQLFPGAIFYFSLATFIIGNFIFTYLNLIGAYQREKYEIVKSALFSPIYWILLSVATFRAFYQLAFKPHLWEKTTHGKHLG